jgi:hypothetical protein
MVGQATPEVDAGPVLSWRQAGRIASWFALSRLFVLFLAQAAVWAKSPLPVHLEFVRWDSGWYGRIAQEGYPPTANLTAGGNRWAFFPGWPFLIRAFGWVAGGTWRRNAVVLAFVLGFVAAIFIWLTVADVFGRLVADRMVVLFLFLPSAFTLSMAYSESMFIAASAVCLYALQRKWWLVAGAAAAVASATRLPGILLFACCLAAAIAQIRRRGGTLRPLVAPLLAPLGLAAYCAYAWLRTGHPFVFVDAERAWDNQFRWGTGAFHLMWRVAFSPHRWHNPREVASAIVIAAFAVAFVAMWRARSRVPVAWWIFSVGVIAIALGPRVVGPRYTLPAYPVLACAVARVPDRWMPVVVGCSAVLMSALAMLAFGAGNVKMAP